MDPVTAAATAAASESTAAATAVEANATAIAEGTKVASEASEAIISEQGLIGQFEAIKNGSLESVAARNETLLKTRNAELAGSVHPETGVPFTKEVVHLPDGTIREGVFPEFPAIFETTLPDELLRATDYQQAQYSNEQLRHAVENDPALKAQFNETQLEQIAAGDTPDGFTWHHHQEPGRMQLVDTNVHMGTGHTGGKEIWGDGR